MIRYKVAHTTGFKYLNEATASYNEIRMLPSRSDRQFVLQSKLDIQPSTSSHEYVDYFGTRVVVFEVLDLHDALTIRAINVVEIRPSTEIHQSCSWSDLENYVKNDVHLFDAMMQTERTQVPADLAKLAKSLVDQADPSASAEAICREIFAAMTYKPGVTGVHSNASEAWQKKEGVCQDFAHLAIGALRAVGIPARYVSGYLHPALEPVVGKKIKGESHAWVEWFAGSWQAFDPTNDIWVGDRHIHIGNGRDYDDIPPLRGVFAGAGSHELFVEVEITRES